MNYLIAALEKLTLSLKHYQKQIMTPEPQKLTLLPQLAQGIFQAEGGGAQAGVKYNNRGDLRGRPGNRYLLSLGATGYGENGLAIFPDMLTGDHACLQLCTDVANNLLIAYPKPCSIKEFAKIYGDPTTQAEWDNYVSILCKATGRTPETFISDLK
jgi:hypothetical protein